MSLWEGDFGDAYTERNAKYPNRQKFWRWFLKDKNIETILEIGCNRGFNLAPISRGNREAHIWGVDINKRALHLLHKNHPHINGGWADVFELPFMSEWFDFVFCVGLLIHIHPNNLHQAINEMWRVCGRYLMVAEYYSPNWEELPYYGQRNALFKGPYGEFVEGVIGKKPIQSGLLESSDGFDNVTFWLFEV